LLEANADINFRNKYGRTAIDISGNMEIEILLKRKYMVEQMIRVVPLPVAGGHVVLFEWIAEYCL